MSFTKITTDQNVNIRPPSFKVASSASHTCFTIYNYLKQIKYITHWHSRCKTVLLLLLKLIAAQNDLLESLSGTEVRVQSVFLVLVAAIARDTRALWTNRRRPMAPKFFQKTSGLHFCSWQDRCHGLPVWLSGATRLSAIVIAGTGIKVHFWVPSFN